MIVASRVCPWVENRYRLVSLLEIMQRLDLKVLLHIQELSASLLARISIAGHEGLEVAMPVAAEELKPLRESILPDIKYTFERMNLPLSAKLIENTLPRIDENFTYEDLGRFLEELNHRFIDEAGMLVALFPDQTKVNFYKAKHLFGEEVTSRFPSATIDIEEAGKCLALSRSTACVFHLMRVMEAGLRIVADSLHDPGINPKTNPTWDRILHRFDAELQKPLAQRSQEWQADEPFFSGVAARLRGVKDAWRNPTMHVENIYTEEQSTDIWHHVGSFMRHLAAKLSE